MYFIAVLIFQLCRLYTYVLIARVILDFVQIFKPDWRPQGLILLLARAVYIVTDPPLRFLARYIPPLRMGGVAFDVGFVVLYFAVQLVQFAAHFLAVLVR